jgi:pimeloyl-ACP methyl ester carboxylesterase
VDTVVPDLRGFGESDKHAADPRAAYDAAAQARSIIGHIEELNLDRPVLAGCEIGSRVAQSLARTRPELVRGLVLSPPLPGVGDRILSADAQSEFWHQPFHQLPLVEQLLDGRPEAVRSYLAHFWERWSAPNYSPDPAELDRLATLYSLPEPWSPRSTTTGPVPERSTSR